MFRPRSFCPKITLLGLSIALFATQNAFSAPTPTAASIRSGDTLLPGSIDSGRVGQDVDQRLRTRKRVQFDSSVPSTPPSGFSKEALQVQFTLSHVTLTGGHVYAQNQLVPIYQSYIGKKITLGTLQTIADAITAKYRNDGYILSQAIIPPQHIKQGDVTLQLVEGYIEKTQVVGKTMGTQDLLQSYAAHVAASRPLRIQVLEHYALLANDIPGITVKTLLAPSKTTPGAADLTFVAKASRYDAYASYDNRGTRYLGPREFLLGGNLNSIFRAGDRTGLRTLLAVPTRELRFFELNHEEPIGTRGMRLLLTAQNTHTRPGYTLAPLDIAGITQSFTAKLTYPLLRSRMKNWSVSAEAGGINSRNNILNTELSSDRIRSLRVGTAYQQADSWLGINQVTGLFSQGILAFGSSNQNATNLSRVGGHPNYSKVNVEVSRLQSLPYHFSVLASAAGQYAFNALLASEQFGYGGSVYGRAYDPSEIVGDRGVAARAEVRFDHALNYPALRNVQYYTFYDVGAITNINTRNQVAQQSGSSTGLGARMVFSNHFLGSLEVAQPLTRSVAALSQLNGNGRSPRVFFSITALADGSTVTPSVTDLTPPERPQLAPL